jgi:hypothetical protein
MHTSSAGIVHVLRLHPTLKANFVLHNDLLAAHHWKMFMKNRTVVCPLLIVGVCKGNFIFAH